MHIASCSFSRKKHHVKILAAEGNLLSMWPVFGLSGGRMMTANEYCRSWREIALGLSRKMCFSTRTMAVNFPRDWEVTVLPYLRWDWLHDNAAVVLLFPRSTDSVNICIVYSTSILDYMLLATNSAIILHCTKCIEVQSALVGVMSPITAFFLSIKLTPTSPTEVRYIFPGYRCIAGQICII